MKQNDLLKLTVLRMGYNGEGVASANGYTVFVPGALPGETVTARVILVKKNYAKARLVDLLTPSPERAIPSCPVYGKCGGCQLMHLRYKAQLEFKRAQVVLNLEKIGQMKGVEVKPCLPSPRILDYRNKIEVPFREQRDGPVFGFFEFESHDVVPFERCAVHCSAGDAIFSQVRRIVFENRVRAYDERLNNKSLRHVLIKTAVNTGQALVVLVSCGAELKRLREVTERIMTCHPAVRGVVQNVNQEVTNVILGRKFKLLAGKATITEQVLGLKFNITATSFFQINPFQLPHLMEQTALAAKLSGTERVADVYSGVGLFSLYLAGKAREVVGVESVHDAVRNAEENARLNDIRNVSFLCGRAERVIGSLKRVSTVIMDPPRAGCEEGFLRALAGIRPGRVVYVSCNPATLARDLAFLCGSGYKIESVQPLDMFPQTAHVETVVALRR